nr:hypothetical protein B7L51_01265 [Pectobacterium carotovorum]
MPGLKLGFEPMNDPGIGRMHHQSLISKEIKMNKENDVPCFCLEHWNQKMICPKDVTSPQNKFKRLVEIIVNSGPEGFSLAWIDWDDLADGKVEKVLAIRWNGYLEDDGTLNKGYPVNRGFPSWFIVPVELEHLLVPDEKFPHIVPPRKP